MDIGYNSDDELPVDKSPVDKLLIDNIKKLIQGLAMEIDLLFRICPTCPPVLQIKGGMSYQEYFDITKNIWDQMIKPTCKAYIELNKDINDPTIQFEIAKNIFKKYLKNIYIFEINSILSKDGFEATSETIYEYINRLNSLPSQYDNTSFKDVFLMTELQKNQIVRSIEGKPDEYIIISKSNKKGGKKTRKLKKYRKTRKSKKNKNYKKSRFSRKI